MTHLEQNPLPVWNLVDSLDLADRGNVDDKTDRSTDCTRVWNVRSFSVGCGQSCSRCFDGWTLAVHLEIHL